jgi:hypothetical protein
MQLKEVSVNRNRRIPELNDDLYALAVRAGRKFQQRMLVEP